MSEEKSLFEQIVEQDKIDKLKDKDESKWEEEIEIALLSKTIDLPKVKEICNLYLYMPDDGIVDFILAVYLSNFTAGERLWTWFVGPPSVGKTELLRALVSDASILKDSLTANTLFSGLRIGGKDPSLFRRINRKVLIIKDFTKILSDQEENLTAILGQLRCAYDGYYNASTGAEDKDYHYETNFTLIAGVTPAIDDHYSIRQQLGERFLSWRIENIDREKLLSKVKENRNKKDKMRMDLRRNFGAFIKKYRELKKQPEIDDKMITKIGELADMITWARTPVPRFGYTREVRRIPEKEGSPRFFEQLLHLSMVLTLIRDKEKTTAAEYALIYKVALNSMLPERILVIEAFFTLIEEAKKEDFVTTEFWFETPQISDHINLPTQSARIILDDLFLLKILFRKGENPLLWHLDSTFAEKWRFAKPAAV